MEANIITTTNRPPENLTWHPTKVKAEERYVLLGQRGVVIWLTGLSGAGKSTIAVELERRLLKAGHMAFALDGDNVRHGLSADLGFSDEDRCENIRRVGHVAKLLAESGVIVIAAFISPFEEDRLRVRELMPPDGFIEVHVAAPIEVCEARDPKGLYRRAREGKIPKFTGISSPYEVPENADIVVQTDRLSVEESIEVLGRELQARAIWTTDRRRPQSRSDEAPEGVLERDGETPKVEPH